VEEIKQFDIWVCDFTKCGDFSDYGLRPCIVVSNNICNSFSDRVNVIPLTTSAKKPQKTHCIISSSRVTSTALCENIMMVYKERLTEKCGSLNDFEKQNILYCLKQQFEIN
jgi:mRNA interferase MazF